MSAAFLIIDGYNLMHAAGLARANYGPGDLGRQRHELLVRLARRLTIDERKRCTVVFDAIDAPPNLPNRLKYSEMLVLFAKPGHEADELIETLISQHSATRRLTVVSSDHRLQNAIRRRRGIGLDSEVFLKDLESPLRQIKTDAILSVPTKSTEGELAFWLEEFGTVNPESLNHELLAQSGDSKSDWERRVDQLQKRLQDVDGLDDWIDEPDNQSPPQSQTGK